MAANIAPPPVSAGRNLEGARRQAEDFLQRQAVLVLRDRGQVVVAAALHPDEPLGARGGGEEALAHLERHHRVVRAVRDDERLPDLRHLGDRVEFLREDEPDRQHRHAVC